MPKILLIQGANMSYLGRRQPEIYGTTSAAELDEMVRAHARDKRYEVEIFYTHLEGEAIARLYRAVDEHVDGVVMNPAGFTYAGYALRDCLQTLPFPYVEVHMTTIAKRGLQSVPAAAGGRHYCGLRRAVLFARPRGHAPALELQPLRWRGLVPEQLAQEVLLRDDQRGPCRITRSALEAQQLRSLPPDVSDVSGRAARIPTPACELRLPRPEFVNQITQDLVESFG